MAGAPAIPDYALLRPIGRGAYGEVWLARSVTGIYRAAKIVYRSTFEEARPFEREFEGVQHFEPLSRIQQNLIDVLHVGRNDDAGYFYYIMELADDAVTESPLSGNRGPDEITAYRPRTLKEVLARRRRMPAMDCLPIAIGLCNALQHLHEHRLIHRDVKPSNIIFIDGAPRLADLGLLSAIDATGSFVGTEGYVPREGPGTAAADLYSLGKVLYEMSTGRPRQDFPLLPEDFESLDDRRDLLELNEVIVRACADRAADRYSSAADMRSELLLLQAGKSVKRLHAAERRLKRLIPIVAGIGLLAAVALVIQQLQTRNAHERARVEKEFRQRAETQELATRQLLYAADMNLVQQALAAGDLGRARELLIAHVPGSSDLRGFEWYYFWGRCEGDQVRILAGHSNAVAAVEFSPDGRRLATGAYDGNLMIWDVATGRPETSIQNTNRIETMGWSHDGTCIAFADRNGNCDVREIATGTLVFHHSRSVAWTAMSPDRDAIAIAEGTPFDALVEIRGGQSGVSVWNFRTGEELFSLPDATRLAVFSTDGRRLATRGSVRTIEIWDVASRRKLTTLDDFGPRSSPAFSPDGRRLVVGDESGRLRLYEADTGKVVRERRAHEAAIWDVAYAPDGRRIATASTDQTVRLFDTEELLEAGVFRGHVGEVWSVAFSADGSLLASGSKDGTARLWSVNARRDSDVLTRRVEFWHWPVSSANGKYLAISEDHHVTVRLTADGTVAATLASALRPLGFLRGDRELLTIGARGDLQSWTWREETLRPSVSVPAGLTNIYSHAIVSSSSLLAVGEQDGTIELWDLNQRQRVRSWKAHAGRIVGLAASPDGGALASSTTQNEVVNVWSIPDGNLKMALSGHSLGVFSVTFSPDGRILASASPDDTCRLWDPVRGGTIAVLTGHKGGAYHATFSGDGRTLAVGTGDRKVKLWNLPTFRDLGTIDVEPVTVFFTGFIPDQSALATVSFDFARTNCSLRLLRALPLRSPPARQASSRE